MHLLRLLRFVLCVKYFTAVALANPFNLAEYLLSKYAAEYQKAAASPVFYQRVLNGTVDPGQVAYFFEQDSVYGRGFTTLTGQTLNVLTADLTAPTSNRTLTAIDNMGQTASGLSAEDGFLTRLRDQLVPGSSARSLCPSAGTLEYVTYMKEVSSSGDGFAAFVCSWTMGQAFVDVWQSIQQNQAYTPNKIPQLQQVIDYWADPSYAAAIYATRDLMNEWYTTDPRKYLAEAELVFSQTLEKEDSFWTSVDAWKA